MFKCSSFVPAKFLLKIRFVATTVKSYLNKQSLADTMTAFVIFQNLPCKISMMAEPQLVDPSDMIESRAPRG